ncbi:hypothetical protein [Metabacillus sp. cB07]|uniref:hypothetical protein n=1 Tax=Metabacillus sp. cB07 TaxID=2806989 RepID=UPI001939ED16|nr:hypothetical protein [Metabacillus sp. cB07]
MSKNVDIHEKRTVVEVKKSDKKAIFYYSNGETEEFQLLTEDFFDQEKVAIINSDERGEKYIKGYIKLN